MEKIKISLDPEALILWIEKVKKDTYEAFFYVDSSAQIYADIIKVDANLPESKLVKYADKLSAYVKCLSELKGSNNEFLKAKNSIEKELENIDSDEVKYFMQNFIKPYSLTLDELD